VEKAWSQHLGEFGPNPHDMQLTQELWTDHGSLLCEAPRKIDALSCMPSFKLLTFRSPSNHHSVIFSLGVLKDAIVFYLIITRRANGKMLKYYTYRRFTAI